MISTETIKSVTNKVNKKWLRRLSGDCCEAENDHLKQIEISFKDELRFEPTIEELAE